jgi:hypothetical protein
MLGKHGLSAGAFILGLILAISAFGVTAQNPGTSPLSKVPSSAVKSQTAPPVKQATNGPQGQPTSKLGGPTQYPRYRFGHRAKLHYGLVWGVDSLSVKSVESGQIVRFAYRVLDPAKAKMLNDKKNEPYLECPRARVKLVIPQMPKVGKLRQTNTPEEGKSYWMGFSNKGGFVRKGDRVNVVIGQFRADGLIVD